MGEGVAVVLVGFQKDYFGEDGVLRGVIQESFRLGDVVARTRALLDRLRTSEVLFVETPIVFTPDFRELGSNPTGILRAVREHGAFVRGTPGSETVAAIADLGDRVLQLPGKHGINAFSNTGLDEVLREHRVHTVVLAGAVTSICIDSTARSAYERGLNVVILSDCISARTVTEHEFYCEQIFPLYARVLTAPELLDELLP
jgi:nicotinamidase-related amidase